MTDDFRTRLEKEVAALDAPPLGDLVRTSMAAGRRLRRVRRWYRAGAITAAALAVTGVVMGVQTISERPETSDEMVSVPATVMPMPSPTEVRAKATPEGLLAGLLAVLPAGTTSNYAGHDAVGSGLGRTPMTVQTYLDDGNGPGMIRLSVWTKGDLGDGGNGSTSHPSVTQPDGDVVTVIRNPENCIQAMTVYVEHSSGVVAAVNVASCLAYDGRRNTDGRMALSEKQAIALADDERLGTLLPQRWVDEGAERFSDLPTLE